MSDDAASLAARAERAQDPGEGLRAISVLREQIDELEARQVARALERSWSWAQVGRALGISKQAAHRRHAGSITVAAEPLTSRSGSGPDVPRVVITGTARAVVARAREEAAALGDAEVLPTHLLVALLREPAGPAQDALMALGLDIERAREELTTQTPTRRRRFARRPEISQPVRIVLEDSLAESQRLCHGHIGPEHLLLALLRDEDNPAVGLIRDLGATTQDVEGAICDVLKHTDFARSL